MSLDKFWREDDVLLKKKCVIASKSHNISKAYQQKKALEKKWMSKHDFMRWYEYLQDFTFKSLAISIELDEANSLVRLYHHRVNKNKPLSPDQQNSINKFKKKIQKRLSNNSSFDTNAGFFIRLSSR